MNFYLILTMAGLDPAMVNVEGWAMASVAAAYDQK